MTFCLAHSLAEELALVYSECLYFGVQEVAPEFPGVEAPGWNVCVADASRKDRWVAITQDGKSCKQPSWLRVQEGTAK